MAKIYDITVDELRTYCDKLRAGDKVLLSGTIYTARDAAHKRFNALLDEGKPLPVDIRDAVIYYAGPTPAPEGMPIGSCGPTTS
ncbi:MAG: fumarate hydratase C-terminal domain-containing protein, partial [Oscillospiraceae bacterium]